MFYSEATLDDEAGKGRLRPLSPMRGAGFFVNKVYWNTATPVHLSLQLL